jgi:hypothetical protein
MCQALVGFECASPAQLYALEVVDFAVLDIVEYRFTKISIFDN